MLLVSVFTLLFSCQKEPNDSLVPPPNPTDTESIRLKSFVHSYYTDGSLDYQDSTIITADPQNHMIKLWTWSSDSPDDSSRITFTYDSNNQLIEYQKTYYSYSTFFDIAKMRFTRDMNGRLLKCYSEYQSYNNEVPPSEGTFTYSQSGDTNFISFIDSVPKGYGYDGVDNYKVAFVNNRIVYAISFEVPGQFESTMEQFRYDGAGNLREDIYGKLYGNIYDDRSYTRLDHSAAELQKFSARLFGDLWWFSRAKLFYPPYYLINEYYLAGNAISSIQSTQMGSIDFINVFDAEGNLKEVKYSTPEPNFPNSSESVRFEYWPK